MSSKTALLFTTHIWNQEIEKRYLSIRNRLISKSYDIWSLIQSDSISNLSEIQSAGYPYYPFSKECLISLNYKPIYTEIVPGSNHFPVLQFYRDKPDYTYYWNIEYDVLFHGDWRYFFQHFEKEPADFISSDIHKYGKEILWPWWNTLHWDRIIPMKQRLRSFNPIYRLSNKAISFIDKELRKGAQGHHEVLLPTLLTHSGFILCDLGRNRFFPQKDPIAFYTTGNVYADFYQTGSMRYRPAILPEEMTKPNTLYHPCKL